MNFERVYAVWDYYDGVRSGIADYCGSPHFFTCEWDGAVDDYAETFTLTLIDSETLALALEQEGIWRQWEHRFHEGEVPQLTHPALPGQNERYAELKTILNKLFASRAPNSRVRAIFQPVPGQPAKKPGIMAQLEVRWEALN